ncbi:MAG: SBBP repeat-containing protein, partial [Candidatus Hermodarchaeota archaeon]
DLEYSTYVGGNDTDMGYSIAVDDARNAYITGITHSSDFPTLNNYMGYNNFSDVFVFKLAANSGNLEYSTYVGGNNHEQGNDIAVDGAGHAYITGKTRSIDFPTKNPYDDTSDGNPLLWDVFVFKLAANGGDLEYSTYVSGTSSERGIGIAVDDGGNAYVTGETYSTDFPTVNEYMDVIGGWDAFVFKLTSSGGDLIYSTYVGGDSWDTGKGIAVDGAGNAYITGQTRSTDFPTKYAYDDTADDIPTYSDAFVIKLTTDGGTLHYSTYLGGNGDDIGHRLAVDDAGNVYVTGETNSTEFPTANAYQGKISYPETSDVFVIKLSWDATPPVIDLISPENNSEHVKENDTTIELDITDADSGVSQVKYHWDEENNRTMSYPYNTKLPNEIGQHTLYVYVEDKATNVAHKIFVFNTITPTTTPSSTGIITGFEPGFVVFGFVVSLILLSLVRRRRDVNQ